MKGLIKMSALFLSLAMLLTTAGCGNQSEAGPSGAAGGQDKPGNASQGSNWPEREIRLIVPYKEGGGSHKSALMVKSTVEKNKLINQPIVVVCMPNAATLEGQEEVLNAQPDGYTLLIHHNAMVNNFALGKQDFTYSDYRMIGQIYQCPLVIGVRADSPFNSLDDIVTAVKQEPGKYSWTWVGIGGNTQFCSYVFYDAAGLKGTDIVPSITKSDGDSIVSLLGGTSDIAIAQPNAFYEYVKSGEVKVLGHSGEGDLDVAGTTVKSWTDLGYPGTYNLRCFIFAPKDTPEDIAASISKMVEECVASEDFVAAMNEDGFIAHYLNEEESIAAFKEEAESAIAIAKIIEAEGQ